MPFALQRFYDTDKCYLFNSETYDRCNLHRSWIDIVSEIPNNITKLTIKVIDKHPIAKLPSSITHLKIKCDPCTVSCVIHELPSNLIYLSTDSFYADSLPTLPQTLQYLTIGSCLYKHPLPQLPHSLTRLHLNYYCKHTVDLPPNITHFSAPHFSDFAFYPKINKLEKLVKLGISADNYNDINSCGDNNLKIPSSVTHLHFTAEYKNAKNPVILHEGIICVKFDDDYNQPTNFPNSIRKLNFGSRYNQPTILPPHAKNVTFGLLYNHPTILPEGIEHVEFLTMDFDHVINLPQSIQTIDFGYNYKSSILLPSKVLNVACNYQQALILPDTVRKVIFRGKYNQSLILPPHVEHVEFEGTFDNIVDLPSSVKYLSICQSFNPKNILPPHLEYIYGCNENSWNADGRLLEPFVEQLLNNYNLVGTNIVYSVELHPLLLKHMYTNNHNKYFKNISLVNIVV